MSTASPEVPPRIVIGSVGLDGHDRGIKVVATKLRSLGFEVLYMGTHQTLDRLVAVAVEEDADLMGLSCHAGEQVQATADMRRKLDAAGLQDVAMVVGGTFPVHDIPAIRAAGADVIVRIGQPLEEVAGEMRRFARRRHGASTVIR
jgi:methylmalonyl-CoA mutase C-terminal domain/subunit